MKIVNFSLLVFIVIVLLFITMSIETTAQSCDCQEYIYLNETTNDGRIHKFLVNENFDVANDPANTSIISEIGNPWFDNAAVGETVTNPHGLANDLNGYLYIGEGNRADQGNAIRRFSCDGTIIPASTFEIPDEAGYNIGSLGNTIYVGTQAFGGATEEDNTINAYDLCTGDPMGFYCLNGIGPNRDWGLYLEDDGIMYITSDFNAEGNTSDRPNNLYRFNITNLPLNAIGETSPTCIDPFISEGAAPPSIGSNLFARDRVFGVTADSDGNIYIVERTSTGDTDFPTGAIDGAARILKYDSNGVLVSVTPYDIVEGDGGYVKAIGIYYSETLDMLFVSTSSPSDDCVALFDTDLNYLGPVVPSPGDGSQGKGINIQKECCPNPSNLVIDTILCNLTYPTDIFLQDIINCDGVVCEGQWAADAGNTGLAFNDCDNSITINGNACGSFNLFSDGSSGLAQCGQFSITVNIETANIVVSTISGDQTVCANDAVSPLTATSPTAGVTYQWQMSTTDCTTGFTDIAGATAATYTPTGLSTTTYYRVVTSVSGGCASGNCEETSNCITVTVENCVTYDLRLGKTADATTANIGDPITYTLTVYNEGTGDMTGVEVTDILPSNLTYTGDDSGGLYDPATGIWMVGTVLPGDSAVIEIYTTINAAGVISNTAEITAANEIDLDSTPGDGLIAQDDLGEACLSVPIEICDNEVIDVTINAPTGYTNYQWYKDGVLIAGATGAAYTATEPGSYVYTVDGVGPGDCMGELCCPIVIEQISCCPDKICLPITINVIGN